MKGIDEITGEEKKLNNKGSIDVTKQVKDGSIILQNAKL